MEITEKLSSNLLKKFTKLLTIELLIAQIFIFNSKFLREEK